MVYTPHTHIHCTKNTQVPESIILEVAGEDAKTKYRKFALQSYVDDNPRMAWCPSPGCQFCVERLVDITSGEPLDITCKCTCMFCFSCKEEAHRPVGMVLCGYNTTLQMGVAHEGAIHTQQQSHIYAHIRTPQSCYPPVSTVSPPPPPPPHTHLSSLTHRWIVKRCASGSSRTAPSQKTSTGSWPTPNHAPSASAPLRKTMAACT